MRLYVLCAISLAACAFEPNGSGDPGDDDVPDPGIPGGVDASIVGEPPIDPTPPTPQPPTLDCRIEGEHLGIIGARVSAGSRMYTFESWQSSASGAVVGFTLTGPSNVRYEVRTDGERHSGDSLVYQGDERITRVDFCVASGGGD